MGLRTYSGGSGKGTFTEYDSSKDCIICDSSGEVVVRDKDNKRYIVCSRCQREKNKTLKL